MVSARGRRQQVAYAHQRGLSKVKACKLLLVARSTLAYRSELDERDTRVVERMTTLARAHPRYGYRRIRILLGREGLAMSAQRAYRLWRKGRLQVRRKPRRRVPTRTTRPTPPEGANHVWCYDFVFDSCANGQALKCLTVVDEYTRECLAIHVSGNIRSADVSELLGRLIAVHGAPLYLRSDNGPEFVAAALQKWIKQEGIETAYIAKGKPWQNGLNESFNGKFRDECLDMEWFATRREAAIVIEEYRKHYNSARPHSSLGYRTPHEYKKLLQTNPAVGVLTL